ncbi:hypothetical protein SAMN03159341_111108 [Paenibacillus sp. 1_12]|uniref:hypothetical protein n=1 Tax=Paenibacillus sp. 1_12 TaxID=1566278 RepID=UPI0008EED13A|nr:hypothetical protein [Paenibacillus sp. 1_12]SFL88909.1 hypothetical protein SAMN03159341_111108 [Paenibacillus sp. 1_12]
MMVGLLWIVGSYAVSIVLMHWYYRRELHESPKKVYVWLITYNNQTQVEWFIRSLQFFSKFKGRDIQMIVADQGSTDETLAIAERLRVSYQIDIQSFDEQGTLDEWIARHEDQQVMVIRLGHQEILETAYKMM